MNKFEKCLMIVILENIINEIKIVNKENYKILKSLPNRKNPVDLRFKNKIHESVYEQLNPFHCIVHDLNEAKLQQDIYFLITILVRTINELLKFDSPKLIMKVVKENEQEFDDEELLLSDYENNKLILRELQETFSTKIKGGEQRLHSYDEILMNLKSDLSNIRRVNLIEKSLVVKWEKTRVEQALYMSKIEADKQMKIIETFKNKIFDEEKAMKDIITFYKMQQEDHKNLIDYWKQKYTNELNELQRKISIISKKINEIEKKNEKHYEIYVKRQEFIDEYLEKKDKEQKEYEFHQKRIYSAIKIQSWWRGTMVRKNLGPYKKKKKNKRGRKK